MKIFSLIFFAATGFAALPPLYQSTREIQALLTDSQLGENLGSGEMIEKIIRIEDGYLVITPKYKMIVNVHYQANAKNFVGPAKFELEFNTPMENKPEEFKPFEGSEQEN